MDFVFLPQKYLIIALPKLLNMQKILILALIFTATIACDRNDTLFTKNINNTSSKTINFYFYGSFNPMTYGDTVTVMPGEFKEIHFYKEENSNVGVQQRCDIYDDSIRVEVIGGGTLTKDLTEESDWRFEKGAENSQNCIFEITDTDIL